MLSFIETQFPIARLSAESYKERKAGASQTLTGLGKWWGRKPLVLVRASILGMLMPASNDPKRDREIFLKVLTMDDMGTWERCKPAVKRKTTKVEFDHLPYADRISDCERPENVSGPSKEAWSEINAHLGTDAASLAELIDQLGKKRFSHTPRVGDSFCGGGSIPFEAARIGCEAYASDLNPVAGLLTWAGMNLLGANQDEQAEIRKTLQEVFEATEHDISEWGIESNEKNERAEAYLYCLEVKPEGCDYYIPLAPNWVVSEKYASVAVWKREENSEQLQVEIKTVSATDLKLYKSKKGATVKSGRVIDPFDENRTWSIEALRGPEGLRNWSNEEFVSRENDVFRERLYCIRWIDKDGNRRFSSPTSQDLEREEKVVRLLRERFASWQDAGFLPSKRLLKGGDKTDEPIRTRGWNYWHQLFTPRQLLMYGLYQSKCVNISSLQSRVAAQLKLGIQTNWNSKLCIWNADKSKGPGSTEQTFANQALNPLLNYGTRSFHLLKESLLKDFTYVGIASKKTKTQLIDARDLTQECDIWITDPPYADAVSYHELGDFFLSWYERCLSTSFPEWSTDSRAELAVRGDGDDFRHAMVEIYKNLARNMPNNGLQMVMFTHQDPAVWADLGMILWASGLKATAAWTISTETAAGLKQGNYVQGTVCLVLRKRVSSEPGFLDEVYPLVEDEVKHQIASMQALDESGEPNFNDADYQLAAYAAALKVLTQYGNLDGKDVEHEVFAVREKNQKSDFQIVIERALGIACDTLIPRGLDSFWRDLSLVERYYLRALDIESRGERRQGMYEELARGFGVTDIKPLLKNDKANGARMYTPSGLTSTLLGAAVGVTATEAVIVRRGRTGSGAAHPFASSPLRHLMFAIRETLVADNNPEPGRQYLRDTFGQAYWTRREGFVGLLDWLSVLGNSEGMDEWADDSEASRILAGRLRNDHG